MKEDINLLPARELHNRKSQLFNKRLGRIYWTLLLGFVLIGLVYAGVWITLRNIEQSLRQHPSVLSETALLNETDAHNHDLQAIQKHITAEQPWVPQVAEALGKIPDGITVTSIELTDALFDKEKTSAIVLRGTIQAPDKIAVFEKEVSRLSWVQQIESPLNNFANRKKFITIIFRKNQ